MLQKPVHCRMTRQTSDGTGLYLLDRLADPRVILPVLFLPGSRRPCKPHQKYKGHDHSERHRSEEPTMVALRDAGCEWCAEQLSDLERTGA